MHYYYLKATSEQALWGALEAVELAVRIYDPEDDANVRPEDADETWEPTGAYEWRFTGVALDIIGTIFKATGETMVDEEGIETPVLAAIDGYHANLIADAEGLNLPTIEAPNTPYRVWAGV